MIILAILGGLFVIGIALVALLPAIAGAAIPTVLAGCGAWIAYRFLKKGLHKIKDITK